uniref:UGSC family (seleno)protein n=1 Tax=Parafrankia elaeagni TaxID=222534 RepID=UPI000379FDC1|nr:hypothetical protein [Parafrankia elaeagni]
MLRASFTAEQAGVPAISVVGSLFQSAAVIVARYLGLEEVPLAVYPGRITADSAEELTEKARTTLTDQIVAGLTAGSPRLAPPPPEPEPREIVFRGSIDEVNDHFYDRMWTDGLPVMPPTIDRVEQFLAHTDRAPDEIIAEMLPDRRAATVWNVAANGVMAGCRPEYMPVLLAAVEAIADPAFGLKDSGGGAGWEPLVIINGPVIKELDFNTGTGAQRMGRRANTSIGRFLRLYIRNLAGVRIPPGENDKAGLGRSFHVAIAEDEDTVDSVGWPTYAEDVGVARGQSSVTVHGILGETVPYGDHEGSTNDPETYLVPLVESFGKGMLGQWVWIGLAWAEWHPMLLLSPHCARVLSSHGWTKDRVRQRIWEDARVPARRVLANGRCVNLDLAEQVRSGKVSPEFLLSDDPDRLIPTLLRPEDLRIVVAGNPDMYWQRGFCGHVHGNPVTKLIVPRR